MLGGNVERDILRQNGSGWLSWIGCFGISIVVLAVLALPAYHCIDRYRYRGTEDFVSERWLAGDLKYRYSVLPYVAGRVVAVGMSMEEIRQLLGEADYFPQGETGNEWQYYVMPPGFRGFLWKRLGLHLQFDPHGKVELIGQDRYYGAL